MSGFSITMSGGEGAKNFENRLRKMIRLAPKGAEKAMNKLGMELVEEVRKQSHAAGIGVVTGQYLGSIQASEVVAGKDGASVTVGSSAPQALRLEYGFMGVDSLGRHYAQPPSPHWRPAFNVMAQKAPREVYGAVMGEMKISS